MKMGSHINRELITIHQAAQYTGLAVKTLYTMVGQRRIPFVKFDVALLNDWLRQHTVLPMPEKSG